MPSYWSTDHQSLTTFLLGNMPSGWSTAHPSFTTLFLLWAKPPSDWSTAYQSLTTLLFGKQLFLFLYPSDWLICLLIG